MTGHRLSIRQARLATASRGTAGRNLEVVMGDEIEYRLTRELPTEDIVALYRANGWSSAEKPKELLAALTDSHFVVTAWSRGHVIGIGNAISDGHLVV